MSGLTEKQIELMEKKGFTRWTKNGNDRLYIKGWNIAGVTTNWKKNGKKTVSINGEELSYTKSAIFGSYGASNYVDVKTGEVITTTDDRCIADFIKTQIKSMIPEQRRRQMIITNKKKFDKVCRVMTDFCKKEKKTMNERPFHNRITVSKNFFVATDGKNMVIRDCSDCVDNKDNFSFPLDAKTAKESITVDGLTIVVDGKETDMKDLENQVSWEMVVPDGNYIEKRIHFQKIPAIKAGDESYVTFKNDEIVFYYNDDTETTGFYGDVYLNNLLAGQCDIEEFSLPMKIFYRILHLSKDVVLRQYEVGDRASRVFIAGDYKVVSMPMII